MKLLISCLLFVTPLICQKIVFGGIKPYSNNYLERLPFWNSWNSWDSKKLECNQTLDETTDVIVSPDYGKKYPNNTRCFWLINVQPGNSIRLIFVEFDTEKLRDILTVHDGGSAADPILGTFSGNVNPHDLISSKNKLYLNFTSDSVTEKKGFYLEYKTIKFGCGGQLNEHDNAVYSPGYPDHYPSNLSCIWNITVNQKSFIILIIKHLDTEFKYDVLSVYDQAEDIPSYGLIPLSKTALTHLSGQIKNEQVSIISKTNKIFLEFKTNQIKTGKGFEIFYHTKEMGINTNILISVENAIIETNTYSEPTFYVQGLKRSQLIDTNSNQLLYFRPDINQVVLKSLIGFQEDVSFDIKLMAKTNGMAVDWDHSLLYWIDIQWKTINVFHLSQSHEQHIYTICNITKSGDPMDLVFNSVERVLVWSVIGENPNIRFANTDGSEQRKLYHTNNKQAFHLTIDYENKRYFFVDIIDYSLNSFDFNGYNQKVYMKSKEFFLKINSMSVMSDDLYISNEHNIFRIPELSNNIKKAEILFKTNIKHNKTNRDNFYEYKSRALNRDIIYGFKLLYSQSFFQKKNLCEKNQCSHLCLPKSHSYRCVCPSGYKLKDSEKCINTKIKKKSNHKSDCNTHSIINTLLIALIFVLILIFYVSYKIEKSKTDKESNPDSSKRIRLRLMTDDNQDLTSDFARYGEDL